MKPTSSQAENSVSCGQDASEAHRSSLLFGSLRFGSSNDIPQGIPKESLEESLCRYKQNRGDDESLKRDKPQWGVESLKVNQHEQGVDNSSLFSKLSISDKGSMGHPIHHYVKSRPFLFGPGADSLAAPISASNSKQKQQEKNPTAFQNQDDRKFFHSFTPFTEGTGNSQSSSRTDMHGKGERKLCSTGKPNAKVTTLQASPNLPFSPSTSAFSPNNWKTWSPNIFQLDPKPTNSIHEDGTHAPPKLFAFPSETNTATSTSETNLEHVIKKSSSAPVSEAFEDEEDCGYFTCQEKV